METVKEKDLEAVLKWVRDLRKFCVLHNIDPWATRQALIMALEMDTRVALDRGIPKEHLDQFDGIVKADIQKWMERF